MEGLFSSLHGLDQKYFIIIIIRFNLFLEIFLSVLEKHVLYIYITSKGPVAKRRDCGREELCEWLSFW